MEFWMLFRIFWSSASWFDPSRQRPLSSWHMSFSDKNGSNALLVNSLPWDWPTFPKFNSLRYLDCQTPKRELLPGFNSILLSLFGPLNLSRSLFHLEWGIKLSILNGTLFVNSWSFIISSWFRFFTGNRTKLGMKVSLFGLIASFKKCSCSGSAKS